MVTPFEKPERIDLIIRHLDEVGFTGNQCDDLWNSEPALKVHSADYLQFLETAWEEWLAAGFKGDLMAGNFPVRRMQQRCPKHIDGKAGFYSSGNDTSINMELGKLPRPLVWQLSKLKNSLQTEMLLALRCAGHLVIMQVKIFSEGIAS